MTLDRRSFLVLAAASGLAAPAIVRPARAAPVEEIRIDWAFYNPVSLVLKEQGLLEKAFEADGTTIRWVQSLGSNKALEFLNAGSLDFGSTAGAAALLGRINGNPIKSIYVYSRPEWTALVTGKDSPIQAVGDLKGRKVAVTRGTDPHIFLIRALADAGLTEKDIEVVLLQHPDGKLALERGDVDAWAGLDPLMASAEITSGARLFFRNPAANSWGILNTPEAYAAEHPEVVAKVLATYETARAWALANPAGLSEILVTATKLPAPVIARQLERTELTHSTIGTAQAETILAAGVALQQAGVIKPDVDVPATVTALIDTTFPIAGQ